jgi:hypothetical protein
MNTFLSEIRILASRMATFKALMFHLALLGAAGIWLPRMKGADFLDSQVLGAYACLGLIFAGPAAAEATPDGTPPSFQQAAARILVSVLYGEAVALALLGIGIATVSWFSRGGFLPSPDWPSVAKSVLLGLGATAMVASLAALLTVRFSRRIATFCLRAIFFGLLVLYIYYGQSLPEVGFTGSAICLAFTALFMALLKKVSQ